METDQRLKIASVFRKNTRPKADTPDLMAKLPPELRNRIYEFYLSDALKQKAEAKRARHSGIAMKYHVWHEPPLLRTCKQIRGEAAPMFYKTQSMSISDGLDKKRLKRAVDKIRAVTQWCGPKPFGGFIVYVRVGAWDKLGVILQLLEVMRATDFEPAKQEYCSAEVATLNGTRCKVASQSSIFSMTSSGHGVLQGVLEQAIALGRQAREEDWTEQQLSNRFAAWQKKAVSRRGRETKTARSSKRKKA